MNMIVEKGGAVFFGCWKSCFGGNLKSTPTVEQWKKTGWLGYIGDYTTQLYGDYNKALTIHNDPY